VCGYNPCYNRNLDSSTTYQQHRRYFRVRNGDQCPRAIFKNDLISMLTKWKEEGDRIIVSLDANEHIYKKSIGKALTDREGLAMKEVVGEFTQKQIGTTYFRGSEPIGRVWATSGVTVCNAAIMPAGFGVGDHRLFVIDFVTKDLVGEAPPKVVRPASRRLNTKLPGVSEAYCNMLEKEIIKHRLIEWTGEAYERSRSKMDLRNRLNQIDKKLGEYMRYAEKKCRKIKSGRIAFSPKAALWICRLQVYRSILKYHAGRIRNRGNLKRAARWCDISNPLSILIREVYLCIKTCASQCDYFWQNGKYYRRKHLYNRLDAAKEREDEEAARKILDIIQRERERGFWRTMNYALGKPQGGACFKVQVEKEDGTIDEFTDKDDLHQAIWDNIHRKRFILAEDALLCSGPLRGQFGYNAVSLTARSILNRTYSYPPDFHEATKEILMECARIRLTVPKDLVNTTITPEDWEQH
jgi:hypothetical protein